MMDYGYYVRFVRRDGRSTEEYFYHTAEEAKWHFEMFKEDDSDLYSRIEIVSEAEPNKVQMVHLFLEGEA